MALTTEELSSLECPEQVYQYLNELRRSGVTNMFGAGSYIEDEFSVDRKTARRWLVDWMQRFDSSRDS